MRTRDPSADRTEGHTRTPLSAQTFGPDLWDALHADGRSLPRRHRGCPTTKDVRRATSPFDAPVPVNAAGGAYGNWACPGSSGDRASRGRSADVPLSGRWTDERRPDLLVRAFGGRVSATRQTPVSSRAIWSRLWLRTWTASVIIHVVDAECGGRSGGGRRVSIGLFGGLQLSSIQVVNRPLVELQVSSDALYVQGPASVAFGNRGWSAAKTQAEAAKSHRRRPGGSLRMAATSAGRCSALHSAPTRETNLQPLTSMARWRWSAPAAP